MNDKEKLEAIEKIINKKAEEMDDPPGARGTKLNQLLGGIKQSEYEKQLTEFFTKISEEYSLFSTGFDFSNKKNLEKSTKPMASWADIPEYKKILKEVVEDFIGLVEMPDYEEFENIGKLKKEITEHFDKFFKDPEFDRLMSKAAD